MKKALLAILLVTSAFAQKPAKPLKDGLYAIFKTEFGDITVGLFEKDTPNTVATFVGLAQGTLAWRDTSGNMVKKPMYNDTTFYRIAESLVVQGGSPTGDTSYNCGFTIKDEILPGYQFHAGSLAMANGGPNTGGCQFFFTTGPNPAFNNNFAIFGDVKDGEKVLDKLARVPVHGEKPVDPPKLISVTIQRVGPVPEMKKKK